MKPRRICSLVVALAAVSSLPVLAIITHSAGAWCAYQAAHSIMSLNPYVVVQITLLDPFIPNSVPNLAGIYPDYSDETITGIKDWPFSSREFRLENYYADETHRLDTI